MDAALPPASGGFELAKGGLLPMLQGLADRKGNLPEWTRWWPRQAFDEIVPEPLFRKLDKACPRLPLSYFEQSLTVPEGWADRPAGYLAFGVAYTDEREQARDWGWPWRAMQGRISTCSCARTRWPPPSSTWRPGPARADRAQLRRRQVSRATSTNWPRGPILSSLSSGTHSARSVDPPTSTTPRVPPTMCAVKMIRTALKGGMLVVHPRPGVRRQVVVELDAEARLLEHLPDHGALDLLAELDPAARQRPGGPVRAALPVPPGQQHRVTVEDERVGADPGVVVTEIHAQSLTGPRAGSQWRGPEQV
nr:hypothetical protein [Tessaracoccus coleopterorum]